MLTVTSLSPEVLARYQPVIGLEAPCPAFDRVEGLLRLRQPLWRRAEHACVPDVPGSARRAACAEPSRGGAGRAGGEGHPLRDSRDQHLFAQELFLSRLAEGLPDLAVRPADRGGTDGSMFQTRVVRPSASASRGCTWKRMRARACMTASRTRSRGRTST